MRSFEVYVKKILILILIVLGSNDVISQETMLLVDTLISKAESAKKNKDYTKSNEYYQDAILNLSKSGEKCRQFDLKNEILKNLRLDSRNKEALTLIDVYIQEFENGPCSDTSRYINLFISKHLVFINQGDYEKAKGPLDQAYSLCRQAYPPTHELIPYIYRLYAGLSADMGSNFVALDYAEKAMDIIRKIYEPQTVDYISGFYDIANFAERTGDYERAYICLDSIISSPVANEFSYLPNSYHLLSLVCIRRGEYDLAKKYVLYALEGFNKKFKANSLSASFAYQELGSAQLGLNEVREAVQSYQQAYDIRLKYYGPDHRLTLSSLSSLLRANMVEGDTLQSIERYKMIVNGFTTNYSVENAEKYVLNTLKVGELYEGVGLLDSALVYYIKGAELAKEYYKDGDRVHVQANTLLSNLVPIASREQYSKAAKYHLTKDSSLTALNQREMAFATNKPAILSVYHIHAKNLFLLYDQSNDQGYLEKLIGLGPQFDLIKNEIFRQFLSVKSIIQSAPMIREISLLRLRASYLLYNQSNDKKYLSAMLQAMEETKNISLQSHIYEKNLKYILGIPDSLLRLENQLYLQINQCNAALIDSPSDSIARVKLDLERRYFDLRRNILLQSQKYNRLLPDQDLTINAVQQILDANQMILNYYLDKDELFIICISKKNATVLHEHFNDADKSKLKDFVDFVSHLSTQEDASKWKDAHYFYKKLIPEEIPREIEKLIIIPDNELYVVPFDLLLIKAPVLPVQITNLDYLIKQYEIAYLSGLKHRTLHHQKLAKDKVLAFAPFGSDTDPKILNFPLLRYSDDELDAIGTEFEMEQFIGTKATEHVFKSISNQYDILHIASHAVLDGLDPMNSNILFYPSDAAEDGKLQLWELYTMNIPARLAVLSACQTSDGSLLKGAGLMNIARGFYTAGTQYVLSNLWPVQDFAASQLMEPFYKEYSKTNDAAKALRLAKLNYLNSQSGPLAHPMYWAGWMVQSSELPVAAKDSLGIKLIYAMLLFLALLAWIFLVRRKN